MAHLGPLWGAVTIIGPILFIAIVLWAYLSNRKGRNRDEIAEAEQGAREVREDIKAHEDRSID